MARSRQTLARPAVVEGIGLHTGRPSWIRIEPAEPGAGLRFVRADLPGHPVVPAEGRCAVRDGVGRRTVLDLGQARVETVEHVLAALAGLGVDDARLVVGSEEVPDGGDGSAAPFVAAIREAGIAAAGGAVEALVLDHAVEVRDGDARLVAAPATGLSVRYLYEHPHPSVGRQDRTFQIEPRTFAAEIAPARTFGFLHEVDALRAHGLARGASVENAVVLGPDGLLAGTEWRFADECVRHKILDLIGDLALLGRPLDARIDAARAGHRLNVRFVEALAEATTGTAVYDGGTGRD